MISNDRTTNRTARAVLITLLLVYAPLNCVANEKAGAKALFEEGKTLFVEKKYEAALERFQASVEMYPTYNGYFNLANCYRALRRYGKALATIEEMRETLGPASKLSIQQQFEEFESGVLALVGTLRLSVDPDGATLEIDGKRVGITPQTEPLILIPGYHEVAVWKDGYEKKIEHVQVEAEHASYLSINLKKAQGELFLSVNVPGALVTVNGEPMGNSPLSEPLRLPPGEHLVAVSKPDFHKAEKKITLDSGGRIAVSLVLRRTEMAKYEKNKLARDDAGGEGVSSPVFWSSVAGTAALGIASGVFWGLAVGKTRDVQNNDTKYVEATDAEAVEEYDELRRDARDTGRRYQRAAIGFSVAAGLAAAVSVTLFVLETRDKERPMKRDDSIVTIDPAGVIVRF